MPEPEKNVFANLLIAALYQIVREMRYHGSGEASSTDVALASLKTSLRT